MDLSDILGPLDPSTYLFSKASSIKNLNGFYYEIILPQGVTSLFGDRFVLSEYDLSLILPPDVRLRVMSLPVGHKLELNNNLLELIEISTSIHSRKLLDLYEPYFTQVLPKSIEKTKANNDFSKFLGVINETMRSTFESGKKTAQYTEKKKQSLYEKRSIILEAKKTLFNALEIITYDPGNIFEEDPENISIDAFVFKLLRMVLIEGLDLFKLLDNDPFIIQKVFPIAFITFLAAAIKYEKHKDIFIHAAVMIFFALILVNFTYSAIGLTPHNSKLVSYWRSKHLT